MAVREERMPQMQSQTGQIGHDTESSEYGPVRLGDVLDRISDLIQHYCLLPHPALAVLIASWVANTYTYKVFRYCGYLTLRSATPRCGKTKLLRLIGALSKGYPKPMTIPTAAVLYRVGREVLLLDEVDKLRNADKDAYGTVLAVLNAGFEEAGFVPRTVKADGNFEVKEFPVYGPKGLAGVEGLADTLADRGFHIQMARSPKRHPRLNMREMEPESKRIRERLSQWAGQRADAISEAYRQLPAELPALAAFDERLQDIAEPLVVLASLADAERPEGPLVLPRLLESLRIAAGRRLASNRERGLLAFLDIAENWLNGEAEVFVASVDLVNNCKDADELDWITTPKALAGFLKHFDLIPREGPDGQRRGYYLRREWIEEWRARYGGQQEAA
jgi:hypothetical protein